MTTTTSTPGRRTAPASATGAETGSTCCCATDRVLGPAEAAAVRAEAERAEEVAHDTVQFTRLIKQVVPYEERTGVVETLWRVAAADGINADERGLMRLVSELLGVSDVDSALARQRALAGGA